MKKLLPITFVMILGAGCSGSESEPSSSFPDTVVGSWFICEFNNVSDCSIFDDDGITFTQEGEVIRIEETGQGSLDECNGSPCFSSALSSIEVMQSLVGSYTYSNGQLSISTPGCSETAVLILSNAETFIQIPTCDTEFDGSQTADGSLLRKYDGSVEFVNSLM